MIFFIKLVQFDRLIIDISEVLQNYRNRIGKSWQTDSIPVSSS